MLFDSPDGGLAWHRIDGLSRISDLAVGSSSVWAITDSCDVAYVRCITSVVESLDSGVSWQRVGTPSSLLGERVSAQLVVVDDDHVLLLTSRAEWTDQGLDLVSTNDGGKSWTSRRAVDECGFATVAAVSSSALWFACSGGWATAMERRIVARSDDGGQTWRVVLDRIVSGHLSQLWPVSPTVAYISQARGYLIVTTDGGATWRETDQRVGDGDRGIGPSFFFDERRGVVGDSDPERDHATRLWRTIDGGRTWQTIDLN
jgi:photosystem II stability/assembly factor-like uncharacterized protein